VADLIKILNFEGLKQYDTLIKQYIGNAANSIVTSVAYDKIFIDAEIKKLESKITAKTSELSFNQHLADASNPHQVTKTQVGLGRVDNTSDMDKPISRLTQAAIDDVTTATLDLADTVNANRESLQTQINTLAVATPSDGEVVQARVDSVGVAHSSLKTRMDVMQADIPYVAVHGQDVNWTVGQNISENGTISTDNSKACTKLLRVYEGESVSYSTLYDASNNKFSCWMYTYKPDKTFIQRISVTNNYHAKLANNVGFIRFVLGYSASAGLRMTEEKTRLMSFKLYNTTVRSQTDIDSRINSLIEPAVYGTERLSASESGKYTITIAKSYNNTTGAVDNDSPPNAVTEMLPIDTNDYGIRVICSENYTLRAYLWDITSGSFLRSEPLTSGDVLDASNVKVAFRFRRTDGENMTVNNKNEITDTFKIFYASYMDEEIFKATKKTEAAVNSRSDEELDRAIYGKERRSAALTGKYTITVGRSYANTTGEIAYDSPEAAITTGISIDVEGDGKYGVILNCDDAYYMRIYLWKADGTFIKSIAVTPGKVIDTEDATRFGVRFRLNDNSTLTADDGNVIQDSFSVKYASYMSNRITTEIDKLIYLGKGYTILDVTEDFNKSFRSVDMSWSSVTQTSYLNVRSADVFRWFDGLCSAHTKTMVRNIVGTYTDRDGTARTMYEYVCRPQRVYTSGGSVPLVYDPDRYQIFIVCGVHGREKITPYSAYKFIEMLYDYKNPCNELLQKCDFHVIPVVNQYGFDLWTNENDENCWNNARTNSWGINLNRQMRPDTFTASDYALPIGQYPAFSWYLGGKDADGRPNPTSAAEVPEAVLLKKYFWDNLREHNHAAYIDMHMTVGIPIYLTSVKQADRYKCMNMIAGMARAWRAYFGIDLYRAMNSDYDITKEPTGGATSDYVGKTYPSLDSAITVEICGSEKLGTAPYSLTGEIASQNTTELYQWLKQIVK